MLMKLLKILSLLVFILTSMSACVTTRDQLNQERGIGDGVEPKSSIKSEDIQEEPQVVSQAKKTEVAKSAPPLAAAPQTAPEKGTSSETSPTVESAKTVVVNPAPALKGDLANYGVDELRVEVVRLSGRVEELEHEKQETTKNHQEEIKKYENRIAELEKKLKELQPDTPKVPEGKTPLEAAKESFLSEKYDDSIVFSSQILEKNELGKEAEEAAFLRGEAYFKKQQYNKAIVDFSRFPEKYQKSSLHPKALLRIAECFEAMGRREDAKAFYFDLSDKFPKTAEGKLAKKRMKNKK